MRTERRWKHPWQVVRLFHNGALIVMCSHRWELTAGWCSDLRDARLLFKAGARRCYHDERATPKDV
jgi:hypothetical protein